MGSIKGVAKEVKGVLERIPKARNSDDILYYYVCRRMLHEKGFNIDNLNFSSIFLRRKEYGIPPFETVRRSRQKIQSEIPELRANADVEAMREVLEEEYKAYARGVGV